MRLLLLLVALLVGAVSANFVFYPTAVAGVGSWSGVSVAANECNSDATFNLGEGGDPTVLAAGVWFPLATGSIALWCGNSQISTCLVAMGSRTWVCAYHGENVAESCYLQVCSNSNITIDITSLLAVTPPPTGKY